MLFTLVTEGVKVKVLASAVQLRVLVAVPFASFDVITITGFSVLMPIVSVAVAEQPLVELVAVTLYVLGVATFTIAPAGSSASSHLYVTPAVLLEAVNVISVSDQVIVLSLAAMATSGVTKSSVTVMVKGADVQFCAVTPVT